MSFPANSLTRSQTACSPALPWISRILLPSLIVWLGEKRRYRNRVTALLLFRNAGRDGMDDKVHAQPQWSKVKAQTFQASRTETPESKISKKRMLKGSASTYPTLPGMSWQGIIPVALVTARGARILPCLRYHVEMRGIDVQGQDFSSARSRRTCGRWISESSSSVARHTDQQ